MMVKKNLQMVEGNIVFCKFASNCEEIADVSSIEETGKNIFFTSQYL